MQIDTDMARYKNRTCWDHLGHGWSRHIHQVLGAVFAAPEVGFSKEGFRACRRNFITRYRLTMIDNIPYVPTISPVHWSLLGHLVKLVWNTRMAAVKRWQREEWGHARTQLAWNRCSLRDRALQTRKVIHDSTSPSFPKQELHLEFRICTGPSTPPHIL